MALCSHLSLLYGFVDARAAVAAATPGTPGPGGTKTFVSVPNVTIPDNDAGGIRNVIHVSDPGRIQDLRVSVDIAHTWIGNLRVTLTAPDGTEVLLHNRTGSSQDNLVATYDRATLPSLSFLAGRPLSGDWSLTVPDLAARDAGTLQQERLDITAHSDPALAEDVAGIQIPDADPAGIVRSLVVPTGYIMRDLAVAVDITHSCIGDLVVTLVPPNGTPILRHNRSGQSADNIVRTWRSQDVPALQALRGQDAGGTWRLTVADLASEDIGKLNRWSLEIAT